MRMLVPFEQGAAQAQIVAAVRELQSTNKLIGRHGLSLSAENIQALVAGRIEALHEAERVEFGGGVAKDLVLVFAGSPFVAQATYTDAILEIQELFYEFKNEALEQVPDDELIAKMRSLFDTCEGDTQRLAEALFDGLGRTIREDSLTVSRPGFHGMTDADRVATTTYDSDYDAKGYDGSHGYPDAADPDVDNAARDGYTLSAHRYDVAKWADDTFAPTWEGSSWLDE